MKFFIAFFLIIILSITACLFLPWWSIALVAFGVAALIPQAPVRSFLCGFLALFLTWGLLSWYLSASNDHVLAHKISMVIISRDSPFLLILATALVGAIVGGFAALAGSFVHPRALKQEKTAMLQQEETAVV